MSPGPGRLEIGEIRKYAQDLTEVVTAVRAARLVSTQQVMGSVEATWADLRRMIDALPAAEWTPREFSVGGLSVTIDSIDAP